MQHRLFLFFPLKETNSQSCKECYHLYAAQLLKWTPCMFIKTSRNLREKYILFKLKVEKKEAIIWFNWLFNTNENSKSFILCWFGRFTLSFCFNFYSAPQSDPLFTNVISVLMELTFEVLQPIKTPALPSNTRRNHKLQKWILNVTTNLVCKSLSGCNTSLGCSDLGKWWLSVSTTEYNMQMWNFKEPKYF